METIIVAPMLFEPTSIGFMAPMPRPLPPRSGRGQSGRTRRGVARPAPGRGSPSDQIRFRAITPTAVRGFLLSSGVVQRGLQAIESRAPGPVQQPGEHRRRYLRRDPGGRRRGADDGRHGGGDRPRTRRGPFPQCRPNDAAGGLRQFHLRCRCGAWTYTLDNDTEAVRSLPGEAIVADSFLVTSLDGTASEAITVWVTRHGFTDT